MLPILCCQYHVCWCPGDWRSQGISRHGIDQIGWNIPSLASEELIQHRPTMIQSIFSKIQQISHTSPVKMSYGVSFVYPKFDLSSSVVIAVLFTISDYFEQYYDRAESDMWNSLFKLFRSYFMKILHWIGNIKYIFNSIIYLIQYHDPKVTAMSFM